MTPAQRQAAIDEAGRVMAAYHAWEAYDCVGSTAPEPTEEEREIGFDVSADTAGVLQSILVAAVEYQEEGERMRKVEAAARELLAKLDKIAACICIGPHCKAEQAKLRAALEGKEGR